MGHSVAGKDRRGRPRGRGPAAGPPVAPGTASMGPSVTRGGALAAAVGSRLRVCSFQKKRKTVPLQVQFLYTNVHKLSGT
jgi:hypothetical protein